ncbi:CHAT domain-containing protein [Nocardia bovistercoris]|uniref:CHAT domain-containing protein n=1 Tax=Nocardia bovistercoris TaxID=2785916 RepID=A0A931N4E9_9NOCA|nr:CHAT domain-containing protein [Nocardia bovistercoris]MBH0778642.1 CHAT domain-containing protein [Nocardia bovistercoris]
MNAPDLSRPGGARPTVLVRMADAGDLYMSWRWEGDLAQAGVSVLPGAPIEEAVRALADALPNPTAPGGVEHPLTAGAFAEAKSEYILAQQLSRALLPSGLADQLAAVYRDGVRPRLLLQPSPRVAQVPWEIIAPAPELRLIDIADIGLLAPAGVLHAPGRVVRSWERDRELPVVAVLDPRIPGFRADSALGSVLGRVSAPTPLTDRIAHYAARKRLMPAVTEPTEIFRRTDVDRAWLAAALRSGASRLIYVGHVTAAAPESGRSENAELHLSCTADATGFAEPTRNHRPLSAKDLLLGTHTLDPDTPVAGNRLWPIPSRVALIACESGGDLRFSEALGLTAAMLNGGAELVTASRWPLPTDHAFHRTAGAPPEATPLTDAICAIDTAHEHPDPITTLADWQRTRLTHWRNTPSIENSPILWSAFATIDTRPTASPPQR